MTAARCLGHRRPGITLTEILIAILIMGVGLISLATLFPLGLLRLREGTRLGRAGTTFRTAADDSDARALFAKPTFRNTWYGARDPFVQDALYNGAYYNFANGIGLGIIGSGNAAYPANSVGLTDGLPICYDPLWRAITGVAPPLPPAIGSSTLPGTTLFDQTLDYGAGYVTMNDEARFGAGVFGSALTHPYLRDDPNLGAAQGAATTTIPSAHGLQRLTNFIPWSSAGFTPQYAFTYHNTAAAFNPPNFLYQPPDVVGNVFASPDDYVFNSGGSGTGALSPVLPDLSAGTPQADYRFTWFFTGRQLDANGNGNQFTGEIVVCDSRPFGFDPLPGLGINAPTGETVVEAVYGVGSGATLIPAYPGASVGYAVNDRTVLLRWKNSLADPQVRVGGWICDVTYERSTTVYNGRVGTTGTTFARCNWYQIVKRVDPSPDSLDTTMYRSMVVTLGSPVRTKTLLDSTGNPIHMNVALIMPSVINVFPRSFEVH